MKESLDSMNCYHVWPNTMHQRLLQSKKMQLALLPEWSMTRRSFQLLPQPSMLLYTWHNNCVKEFQPFAWLASAQTTDSLLKAFCTAGTTCISLRNARNDAALEQRVIHVSWKQCKFLYNFLSPPKPSYSTFTFLQSAKASNPIGVAILVCSRKANICKLYARHSTYSS